MPNGIKSSHILSRKISIRSAGFSFFRYCTVEHNSPNADINYTHDLKWYLRAIDTHSHTPCRWYLFSAATAIIFRNKNLHSTNKFDKLDHATKFKNKTESLPIAKYNGLFSFDRRRGRKCTSKLLLSNENEWDSRVPIRFAWKMPKVI